MSPRYFETLGMPLLAGRDFNFRVVERPPVAIVNQTMARRYFPGVDPIGKQVAIDPDPKNGTWFDPPNPFRVLVKARLEGKPSEVTCAAVRGLDTLSDSVTLLVALLKVMVVE